MVKRLIVFLLVFSFNIYAQYCSQYGQDKLINERFIHNKKNGFFVDIGAHDGVTYSNTCFFERELNWKGICFEPLSQPFKKLFCERPGSICINACVSPHKGELEFFEVQGYSEMLSGIVGTYHPRHLERLKREVKQYGGSYCITKVPSLRFNDVMNEHDITHIDVLSIDTEGSELEILKSIDFEKISIDIILVENNYGTPGMRRLLESKGYRFIKHQGDEIYVRSASINAQR